MRCMRAYFSHSLIVDEEGNFGFNRWIDTCVNLLQYIKDDDLHISQAQIKQMNIRNVRDIVPSFIVDAYEETPMPSREEDSVYKKEGASFITAHPLFSYSANSTVAKPRSTNVAKPVLGFSLKLFLYGV